MTEKNEQPKEGGRRVFLQTSWSWLCMTAAVVLAYPLFRFLRFKVPRQPLMIEVNKGFPAAGFIMERDFILFQGGGQGPWAVSRKCTHLGCRLNYFEKEGQLVCPCHQSRFTPEGKLVAGPATRDLQVFQVVPMNTDNAKGYVVTVRK